MAEALLRRSDGVVWRCGPDRVLTLRIDDRTDRAANELFGTAALAWLALDEPATVDQLQQRLVDADIDPDADLPDALDQLRGCGLVVDADR